MMMKTKSLKNRRKTKLKNWIQTVMKTRMRKKILMKNSMKSWMRSHPSPSLIPTPSWPLCGSAYSASSVFELLSLA